MRGWAGAALALALLAGTGPGCGRAHPDGAGRPNVVLVTIDTLRADHLGCYGSATVRTPHLDRLAAEGALFERSYAQTDTTVPSHLSLLASLPLAEHGVLHNGDRARRPVETLPLLFARAGYRSAAFVSAWHLGPKGPLGPVLARHLDPWHAPGRVPQRAEETNAGLIDWLRGGRREPFFLWIHYWDPHMPYAPPPPYEAAYYAGDPYAGSQDGMSSVQLRWLLYDLAGARRTLATRAADVRTLKRALGLSSRGVRRLVIHPEELEALRAPDEAAVRARLQALGAHLRARLPLHPHLARWLTGVRDLDFPRARYAGEVSYVDEHVGRLRAALEALGLGERTILAVTADHGEALGEHGIYFTHFGLHDPVLRVPLIVWAPGRIAPGRHPAPVGGLDVAPTLLALAGLPRPPAMRGRDLFAGAAPVPLVAEAQHLQQVMVLDGRWKLLHTLRSFHLVDAFARRAETRELYDLEADPAEARDLAADRPEVTATLAPRLDGWLAAHRPPPPGPKPGAAVIEQLRALGYVE